MLVLQVDQQEGVVQAHIHASLWAGEGNRGSSEALHLFVPSGVMAGPMDLSTGS